MPFLFLVFICVPIVEIGIFIQVGDWLGVWPTLALIVLTAAIGVAMLKQQGLQTLTRARSRMARQELPAEELAEGVMLAFSGALLLTPGFFTDTIGFALLVPIVRRSLLGVVVARQHIFMASSYRQPSNDDDVIDGEFEEIPSNPKK